MGRHHKQEALPMTQDTPNRVDQSRDGDVFILTINNPP